MKGRLQAARRLDALQKVGSKTGLNRRADYKEFSALCGAGMGEFRAVYRRRKWLTHLRMR
jgi:hypothetical protein